MASQIHVVPSRVYNVGTRPDAHFVLNLGNNNASRLSLPSASLLLFNKAVQDNLKQIKQGQGQASGEPPPPPSSVAFPLPLTGIFKSMPPRSAPPPAPAQQPAEAQQSISFVNPTLIDNNKKGKDGPKGGDNSSSASVLRETKTHLNLVNVAKEFLRHEAKISQTNEELNEKLKEASKAYADQIQLKREKNSLLDDMDSLHSDLKGIIDKNNSLQQSINNYQATIRDLERINQVTRTSLEQMQSSKANGEQQLSILQTEIKDLNQKLETANKESGARKLEIQRMNETLRKQEQQSSERNALTLSLAEERERKVSQELQANLALLENYKSKLLEIRTRNEKETADTQKLRDNYQRVSKLVSQLQEDNQLLENANKEAKALAKEERQKQLDAFNSAAKENQKQIDELELYTQSLKQRLDDLQKVQNQSQEKTLQISVQYQESLRLSEEKVNTLRKELEQKLKDNVSQQTEIIQLQKSLETFSAELKNVKTREQKLQADLEDKDREYRIALEELRKTRFQMGGQNIIAEALRRTKEQQQSKIKELDQQLEKLKESDTSWHELYEEQVYKSTALQRQLDTANKTKQDIENQHLEQVKTLNERILQLEVDSEQKFDSTEAKAQKISQSVSKEEEERLQLYFNSLPDDQQERMEDQVEKEVLKAHKENLQIERDRKIAELSSTISQMELDLAASKTLVSTLTQQRESSGEKLKEVMSENLQLQDRNSQMKRRYEAAVHEKNLADQESEIKLAEYDQKLKDMTEERQSLENRLQSEKTRASDLNKKISELQRNTNNKNNQEKLDEKERARQIQELTTQKDEASEQLSTVTEELNVLKNKMKKWKARERAFKDKTEQDQSAQQQQLEELQSQLQDSTSQLQQALQKNQQLEIQIAQKASEIQELQKNVAAANTNTEAAVAQWTSDRQELQERIFRLQQEQDLLKSQFTGEDARKQATINDLTNKLHEFNEALHRAQMTQASNLNDLNQGKTLIQYYHSTLHESNMNVLNLQNENKKLTDSLNENNSYVATLEQQLETNTKQQKLAINEIETLIKQVHHLQNEINRVEQLRTTQTQRADASASNNAKLQDQYKELLTQNASALGNIANLEKQVFDLRNQVNQYLFSMNSAKEKNAELQRQVSKLEKETEKQKKTIVDLEKSLQQLATNEAMSQTRLKDQDTRINNLTLEVERRRYEISELTETSSQTQKDYLNVQNERDRLLQTITSRDEEIARIKARESGLQSQLDDATSKLSNLEEQLIRNGTANANLSSQLVQLQSTYRANETQYVAEMEALKDFQNLSDRWRDMYLNWTQSSDKYFQQLVPTMNALVTHGLEEQDVQNNLRDFAANNENIWNKFLSLQTDLQNSLSKANHQHQGLRDSLVPKINQLNSAINNVKKVMDSEAAGMKNLIKSVKDSRTALNSNQMKQLAQLQNEKAVLERETGDLKKEMQQQNAELLKNQNHASLLAEQMEAYKKYAVEMQDELVRARRTQNQLTDIPVSDSNDLQRVVKEATDKLNPLNQSFFNTMLTIPSSDWKTVMQNYQLELANNFNQAKSLMDASNGQFRAFHENVANARAQLQNIQLRKKDQEKEVRKLTLEAEILESLRQQGERIRSENPGLNFPGNLIDNEKIQKSLKDLQQSKQVIDEMQVAENGAVDNLREAKSKLKSFLDDLDTKIFKVIDDFERIEDGFDTLNQGNGNPFPDVTNILRNEIQQCDVVIQATRKNISDSTALAEIQEEKSDHLSQISNLERALANLQSLYNELSKTYNDLALKNQELSGRISFLENSNLQLQTALKTAQQKEQDLNETVNQKTEQINMQAQNILILNGRIQEWVVNDETNKKIITEYQRDVGIYREQINEMKQLIERNVLREAQYQTNLEEKNRNLARIVREVIGVGGATKSDGANALNYVMKDPRFAESCKDCFPFMELVQQYQKAFNTAVTFKNEASEGNSRKRHRS